MVSIAEKNTITKSTLEREELISLYNCQDILHHPGKPGHGLEIGTDAETLEECCLLACSPDPAQSVFK